MERTHARAEYNFLRSASVPKNERDGDVSREIVHCAWSRDARQEKRGRSMLTHTFVHVPGIGLKTEKRLWEAGIRTWNDWDSRDREEPIPGDFRCVADSLERSRICLEQKDPRFFADRLPAGLQWRFFPEFRDRTAYLDIETTGLSDWENEITTIAIYDGHQVYYYINGKNLDRFPEDILRYSVVVTYNGKTFDIPFIERYFGMKVPCAHIDLRYVLHSLGLKGGLKKCEKTLGIHRGDLEGLDGFFAVLLWREYSLYRNSGALQTLLAYNIADVLSLETLMVTAYNLKLKETPFYGQLEVLTAQPPENPFAADMETVFRIRSRIGVFGG